MAPRASRCAARCGRAGRNCLAGSARSAPIYRTLAVGAAMLAGRPQWVFPVRGGGGWVSCLLASLARVRQVMGEVLDQAAPSSTRR